MTHEEQEKPPVASDEVIAFTGQVGVAAENLEDPVSDVSVDAADPPHLAAAGAHPYEGTAQIGLIIQESPTEADQATSYASSLFPDTEFSYLGSGRYGVVLADESGRAYKVYRDSLHYSRYEKEAGALKLLSDAGVAPKMHLLVDAGEDYRLDKKASDYTTFGFEDVQIPRQDSGRELPVLVMDRVDAAPIESAEPPKLIDGFCKAADVFIEENIHSWDAEVMVDASTGEVTILDVGELIQKPIDAEATEEAKLANDLEIMRSLAVDFGLHDGEAHIVAAYQQGGLDEVRALLTRVLQPPQQS
jgi:hypothetical protein